MNRFYTGIGRTSRRAFFALIFAGTLAGAQGTNPRSASAARLTDDTKEYSLQRVFKTDAVDRYKMALQAKFNNPMGGDALDITLSLIVKETTKEVKPDGTATINSEVEQGVAKIGELEQDISSQMPKTTTTVDKLGRPTNIKTEGGNSELSGEGNEQIFMYVRGAFYPPKPVKVGDSWDVFITDPKAKKPEPGKEARQAVKGKATLVSVEQVDGMETLKIKATVDIFQKEGDMPLKFEGTSNVDTISGRTVKFDGTLDGTIGPLGKTKAKLSLALAKDEKKEEKKEAKKLEEKKP